MQRSIRVGLLGMGTVGTGVIRILKAHEEKISQVIGKKLEVAKILVRDIEKHSALVEVDSQLLTENYQDILEDASIDMIVEVMGSIDVANQYITQALQVGKHVVTANKDLIALHGDALMKLARQNKCDLYYEASVAGGIPILRTLVNSMASDQVKEVVGIVNGTTNYMLTKMTSHHLSYEQALKQAQELGFAEADPTSDVDGIDAARKMVILTRLAFGMNIDLDDIHTEGIRHIAQQDMLNAKQLGYRIKLLGLAKSIDEQVYVEVGPVLVSEKHPLSSVQNENNAVFVVGAAVGQTMYYGPGAGELPTANSVVSDMINISKNMLLGTTGNVFASYTNEKALANKENVVFPFYYRLEMADVSGMFLELTKIFAGCGASFERIQQNQLTDALASVMVITHPLSVAQHEQILEKLAVHESIDLKLALRVME